MTLDCGAPDSRTNLCIGFKNSYTYSYNYDNSSSNKHFGLSLASSNGTTYRIADESSPLSCPQNFVVVPGNNAFGTKDFCVMKFEAKRVGSTNVPISKPDDYPWANISQADAKNFSKNISYCENCHLITDAEWLTIAHNILSVDNNWSGGNIGSGFVYSGHNDGIPDNALSADLNDDNGYAGTGNSSSSNPNQKRTLKLSNGETIWNFSGNIDEWTSDVVDGGQLPGIAGYSGYVEYNWNNSGIQLKGMNSNSLPSNVTPQAANWTVAQGMGVLFSNIDEPNQRGYIRGGSWGSTYLAGIFGLHLNAAPSTVYVTIGFRVASS